MLSTCADSINHQVTHPIKSIFDPVTRQLGPSTQVVETGLKLVNNNNRRTEYQIIYSRCKWH